MSFAFFLFLLAALSPITSSSGFVWSQSPFLAQMLGPLDSGPSNPFDLEGIRVGEAAPDFILLDYNHRPVQLSRFRGRKIVILVFYRGHW